MVTAVFKNSNTERVRGLWQYDYGQVLRIHGLILPTAVEIDFSLQETGGESTSRVGITRDGVTDVVIPDSMLENGGATQNYSIYAFIYLTDETSGETIKKIIMSVTSRPKPEAFDAPEDAELFREAIAAVNKSAGRAETAEASAEAWAHGHADYPERDEDNAKHYADESKKDAEETKKERTAVSELAVHIDAVAIQVNEDKTDADQYKDQASASAAKALQSEQAAKSSETAAMEAKAGAEAAEGQAELFAAQTEEDKNTVEQAKDVVMGIGQEVVENRNYVQQSVGSFGLIHQQAVTDVNNAGQTQTERVEEAGTAQVSAVQEAATEIIADREQISNNKNSIDSLKDDLDNLKDDVIITSTNIKNYLYKNNAYMSSSGVVTNDSGYNIYKILVKPDSFVNVRSTDYSTSFWGTLNNNNICGYKLKTNYVALNNIPSVNGYVNTDTKEITFVNINNTTVEFYINVNTNNVDDVVLCVNYGFTKLNNNVDILNSCVTIDDTIGIKSYNFISVNNSSKVESYGNPSDGYFTLGFKVKSGDKLVFSGLATAASKYGTYTTNGVTTWITNNVFNVENDGFVLVFACENDEVKYKCTYYPFNSIKIDYKNIINAPKSNFSGLNGVAFGTSLTYRAETTGGYLQYLPSLLNMEFDNQGICGATIYPLAGDGRIYNAIVNYMNYADKNIVIIEGFVNDWYHEAPLGVYTDSDDSSVCGRVRKAINYIMSQNHNITIFLVLDHCGRNITTIDESTTAIRGSHTQYEYYEEIAKVAESLGVPVVKQYAISRINENTPQYFLDDIHMNDLGARQSANSIYRVMQQYSPNV